MPPPGMVGSWSLGRVVSRLDSVTGCQYPCGFDLSCRSLGKRLVVKILAPRSNVDSAVGALFDNDLVFLANSHSLFPSKLIPLVFEGKGKVVLYRSLGLFGQDTRESASLPST